MSTIPIYWTWLGIVACLVQSALFSGLTLAIFSLSQLRLQIEVDGGNADAAGVLELRKNSNQVLATVIWGNISTNVLLTLLSDSVLAGVKAFLFSAVVITLLGEIFPQAYFSRNALRMTSRFLPFLKFYLGCLVSAGQADRDAARLVARQRRNFLPRRERRPRPDRPQRRQRWRYRTIWRRRAREIFSIWTIYRSPTRANRWMPKASSACRYTTADACCRNSIERRAIRFSGRSTPRAKNG